MGPRYIFLFFFLLLCCCKSEAQYPSYQRINTKLVPPLYPLFVNPTAIWNELEPQQEDMIWDSSAQHYKSRQQDKMNYPAISNNAFSTMEVTVIESRDHHFFSSELMADNIDEWLETLPANHESSSYLCTFQDGKLSTYHTEILHPEWEAYSRTEATFLYTKDQIKHSQFTIASGRGNSTSCCKNLPNFLIRKSSLSKTMTFDPYGNLLKSENRSNESWDTCTCGGPKTYTINIERNEKGQPTKVSHSGTSVGGVFLETLYDYQVSTFPQFTAQVKGLELYAYYNTKEILNWHLEHQATIVERIRKTTKRYAVDQSNLNQNSIGSYSPVVSTQIYYTILDNKRRVLAEWMDQTDSKGPFWFYDFNETKDSQTLLTWKFPALMPTLNVDHCAPLYDPQPQQMSISWQLYSLDTKAAGLYKIHNYATASGTFTGTFAAVLAQKKQKINKLEMQLLEDEQGLIRYGCNTNNIFKISYRK